MRSQLSGIRNIGLQLVIAALAGCGGDSEHRGRELAELTLLEAPEEISQGSLLSPTAPSMHDVLSHVADIRADPHVVGVLLRLGPMGGAWGRVRDIRDALALVRGAGKTIHCHFETVDNAAFWLASTSCDRITATPAGSVDAVGVAAQVLYARDLLDSLGIQAEVLQVGAFKGAAEPFTRSDMSEAMRESLGAVLDVLQNELVSGIARGRNLSAERVQELLDRGPHEAEDAVTAGLIDAVMFDDQAKAEAARASSASRSVPVRLRPESPALSLLDVLSALSSAPPEEDDDDTAKIVIAHLSGQITDDEQGPRSADAGPFVRQMRRLADDESVRAVVLRIDSPGGSALASDRMWHAVRRVALKKPVIASVGDMAASGGFYVASAAHGIVAHPTSIVGSIGVVGGKVDASALLDRLGVHVETLRRSEHADWMTVSRPWTEPERARLQSAMDRTYERFIERVAFARHMPADRVRRSAEGRIWSGRDGLDRGLVDRLGDLGAALSWARERAELPTDVRIVEWPKPRSPLEAALASFQGESEDSPDAEAMLIEALGPSAESLRLLALLREESVLTQLPFTILMD